MTLNETTLTSFLQRFADKRISNIKRITHDFGTYKSTYSHGGGELRQQHFFGIKFNLLEFKHEHDLSLDFLVEFDLNHMKKHMEKGSPWSDVFQKWNVKSSMLVVPLESTNTSLPKALVHGKMVYELAIMGIQLEEHIKSQLAQDIRSELLCRCPDGMTKP